MNRSRRSIPFHVTLLTLMVLIVLPLAAALLWLGRRAVDQLEDRSIRHRMAALARPVEGFLTPDVDGADRAAAGSRLAVAGLARRRPARGPQHPPSHGRPRQRRRRLSDD